MTKPIVLKLGILNGMKPALERLASQKFPIKTSYWISRRLRIIDSELATYESKRVELVKTYGEATKDNQIAILPGQPKWNEFIAKFNELCDIEVSLDVDPIKLSDLQVEGAALTPTDLQLLSPILDEES